jgi:hypothetical protein
MAIKVADLAKTASRTSYVKESVRKELNKMGLSQYRTVSDARAKQVAEALKEAGAVKTYRSASQMVRETQKSLAEKNKQEDAPGLTMADLRAQRKAKAEQEAKVQRHLAAARGEQVRAEAQSSAGKPQEEETAFLRKTAKTAVLKPQKVTAPRATTSALRSTNGSPAKPAAEEKPQAIDLAID